MSGQVCVILARVCSYLVLNRKRGNSSTAGRLFSVKKHAAEIVIPKDSLAVVTAVDDLNRAGIT